MIVKPIMSGAFLMNGDDTVVIEGNRRLVFTVGRHPIEEMATLHTIGEEVPIFAGAPIDLPIGATTSGAIGEGGGVSLQTSHTRIDENVYQVCYTLSDRPV